VTPNYRVYALRLQYRIRVTNAWQAVLDASAQPIEYVRNVIAGHSQNLGPVLMPAEVHDQSYVQLRWKFYCLSGASGPRAQLRVDDIRVVAAGLAPVFTQIEFLTDGSVRFQIRGVANRPYLIEGSTNLTTWEATRTITPGTGGLYEIVEPNTTTLPFRFFRARTP